MKSAAAPGAIARQTHRLCRRPMPTNDSVMPLKWEGGHGRHFV